MIFLFWSKKRVLFSIAVTAIDAGDAFENRHGAAEQAFKVEELRDRINEVVAILSNMSFDSKDTPPFLSQANPSLLSGLDQVIPAVVPQAEPPVDSTHLGVHDHSRKRCASELEEHRTVKALKREPQDDTPLILSIQDVSTSSVPFPPPPLVYPNILPPLPAVPGSRPPSRPPTPPSSVFVPSSSFKQQTPVAAAFPAFLPAASTPTAPVSFPMQASNPQPSYPPFPHSSWSDPVVPTRHHHSLSAGSINGPLGGVSAPSGSTHSSGAFPTTSVPVPLTQRPAVPSNGPASMISQPVGRMSRSGSISGTNFRNPYGPFQYNELFSDPAMAIWHTTKASGSASRPGQSNWYMGSEPRRTFSFATSSAPHTAHNSPSDGEDDDDDSDSDESTSGKAATHHVNIYPKCF